MDDFVPYDYWQERLSKQYNSEGVGYKGLGNEFNRWGYRVSARAFRRSLQYVQQSPSDLRVLDIGSGTGFYISQWKRFGARSITGIDITDIAVAELRRDHPECEFLKGDIGELDSPLSDGTFDVVSAMAVLFHIVEDSRYQTAMANIARVLRPGGLLIYSDNFIHGGRLAVRHQVSRSLEEVTKILRESNFDILARMPMRVLMSFPCDSKSRVLQSWWNFLRKICKRGPRWRNVVGGMLYPLEVGLTASLREGPSMEIMVCRKLQD